MIYIGSARHDENGNYVNGAAGDQLQTSSTKDTNGEVSMQEMYTHSKGWYIFRPKKASHADAIAERMETACNNANIGYDQNNRLAIVTDGIESAKATECDCSSLARVCVKEATGTDPGNFTTDTEPSMLAATGLFEDKTTYSSKTPVYNGDVLVTKSKGHTVIVVSGNPREGGSGSTSTDYKAGDKVTLSKTALYASSTASSKSGTKSGTYYIWSAETVNGRIRITNKAKNAGVSGAVTGWVNVSDIGGEISTSSTKSAENIAGTYKVTPEKGLNIRKDAGTSATKIIAIPKGTKVECDGSYKTSGGVKWLYVTFTYSGKSYAGYGCSTYLSKC